MRNDCFCGFLSSAMIIFTNAQNIQVQTHCNASLQLITKLLNNMPIKDAGKKYMKVTAKNTERNRQVRGAYRSAIKNLEQAVADKDTKKIDEYLKLSQKTLDKAVQKGVIKKNTAARKKSRLNKMVVAAKK